MRCSRVRDALQAYLDDALPAGARRRCERHLRRCEDCFAALEAAEPLPALLEQERPEDEPFPGLWPAVRAAIRGGEVPLRWDGLLARHPVLAGAAAALVVVLVPLALSGLLPQAPAPVITERDGAEVPAPAEPATRASDGERERVVIEAAAVPAPADDRGGEVYPTLEEIRSPTAKVYDFKYIGEERVTEVVLIVDEAIEI